MEKGSVESYKCIRTVSNFDISAIAEIPPIDLLGIERNNTYEDNDTSVRAKKEKYRAELKVVWQRRWDVSIVRA